MNTTEKDFIKAYELEIERINFIFQRNSNEGINFCKRTLEIYITAMNTKKPNMANQRDHMHKFFASCVVFESVIGEYNVCGVSC